MIVVDALKKAEAGEHLTEAEAAAAFGEIMSGAVAEPVIAALLTAMQMNGPTAGEVTGAARAMRGAAVKVAAPPDATDIVGTGGDGRGTFNVSTTAAFAAAGAGVVIAKHGNRASTSKSGAADCLAALGYDLAKTVPDIERDIAEKGIGFLFANLCHPAMKHAAPVRRALPFRTVFNLLGPLTNPAGVRRHALGVYSPDVIPLYVAALKSLGAEKALVFCGDGGLDEISVSGPTKVATLGEDGSVSEWTILPEDYVGGRYPMDALAGGTPEENAAITRAILSGEERGAKRAAVLLNAAAAIVAGGKTDDYAEAVALAAESIDSGRALAKLEALVEAAK